MGQAWSPLYPGAETEPGHCHTLPRAEVGIRATPHTGDHIQKLAGDRALPARGDVCATGAVLESRDPRGVPSGNPLHRHTCTHLFTHSHPCTHTCAPAHTCIYTLIPFVHAHSGIHACAHTHVCMHMTMHNHSTAHPHTHTRGYAYTGMYSHTHAHPRT